MMRLRRFISSVAAVTLVAAASLPAFRAFRITRSADIWEQKTRLIVVDLQKIRTEVKYTSRSSCSLEGVFSHGLVH